ncbi:MAG: hypothetical protein K2M00_01120, partial [Muribaculaceae bacterium]|nr:hypothetical protein [Muribaculaceae bacterium]
SNALQVEVTSDVTVKPYTTLQFAMTKDSKESDDFHFVWEEDGTVAGYTTSANVNKPIEIDFLGKAIVPADVPSQHNLLSYFQILLADDELPWTEEYAYRLWQTMQTFEIAANDNEPGYKSDRPVSKFILTSELLPDDMTITDMGDGNKIVKVSKDAFAYANPYYVSIEGVKGRFFSKRLHHAMTKYVTDYGRDTDKANEILMRRFGCMVQGFDYEEVTAGITNEPADHFQMFKSSELVALINMMEEMPVGMHKIPQLKYLLRRLDTHTHPIYPGAAAVSWTTENGYIEFMEMAFGGNNEHFDTQRLILHEKSHFIWAFILNDDIKSRWIELGQWYENPNSSSGWSTTDQTGFVSSYAHDVNPDEDMAESIGYYLKDPEWLKSRNTSKYEFIRDYVMHGTRYISQIPDQFTFEVFNLWPDYDYPGKIIKIEVSTSGNADEDKIVTVDVWLNHIEGCQDGALNGWTRIFSPEFIDQDGVKKSHCADLGLCAVDGDLWHLRGTAFVSKHHKSGDWTAYTISLTDDQGNARFSSSDNDYVWKLWINNSDEDLWTPKYVPNSLKLDIYDSKDDFGHDIQVLHPTFLAYDDRIITGCYLGIGVKDEAYSKGAYGGLVDPSNPKGGLLEATLNINPFDHTAEYFVGSLAAYDKVNGCWVLFPDHEPIQSIMVTTPDPDTTYPEIDLNRVAIYAEPTNPEAPNGETRVTISMFVRDDKSGVESGSLTLRDPQGGQFTFGIPTPQSGNIYWDGDPYEWTYITANCTLAAGSAPGIWGLAEITLSDYALNERTFNLVETLIFEPDDDESNYVLFADMNENNMLSIHLESNEGSTFGFNYRIIHEATGEEISGDQSSKAPYKSAPRDKATVFTVDTSSLPDGDLIVIANVYDESGTPLAAKSCRVEKKPTIILGDVNKDGIIDGVDLNVMIVGVVSPEISTLTPASADMNNDGVINGLDINMLITNIINNQK